MSSLEVAHCSKLPSLTEATSVESARGLTEHVATIFHQRLNSAGGRSESCAPITLDTWMDVIPVLALDDARD